jgi:hypothetical protein
MSVLESGPNILVGKSLRFAIKLNGEKLKVLFCDFFSDQMIRMVVMYGFVVCQSFIWSYEH